MTTKIYSKQNQETAAGPQGSFVQDDLVHLRFELFVGTSAEAYITYFEFNRCTINLCVQNADERLRFSVTRASQ